MGGNTNIGQRDSGYLAVSTSAWVAGLIKPVQRRRWSWNEAMGKPRKSGRMRTSA